MVTVGVAIIVVVLIAFWLEFTAVGPIYPESPVSATNSCSGESVVVLNSTTTVICHAVGVGK